MQRQMHLIQMLFHTPNGHTIMGWAHEDDRQLEGMGSFSYWQDIARTLERACFDGVFFADTPAVHDQYEGSPLTCMKYGASWPTHDPLPLVAAMASVTERLGFGVTLSVSGTPPYLAVRRLSTLDHLSGGRIGWNIVTGHLRAEHRAIGAERMEHDERYDYAEEYLEICKQLWGGLEDGALVMDRQSGIFADTAKVRMVDFKGRYLSCHAVTPTFPSKQGHPVLFQAGSSGRGMAFAVRHAEAVFAIQPTLEAMQGFMGRIRNAAAEAGKAEVPVLFGFQPLLGSTEEEAKRRQREIEERVPLPAALTRLAGTLGIDLSKLDPDKPLEEMSTQASQGMLQAVTALRQRKRRTLREIAVASTAGGLYPSVGTPEQVAAELELVWRTTGCNGFNISPTLNPRSVNEFVDHVVPILQERGVFRREYEATTFRQMLAS